MSEVEPVQTGFYNKESSPLASTSQLLGLLQGVRQQQLFNAEMSGKAAAGNAFLNAGDPSDPSFVQNMLGGLKASNNPFAAVEGSQLMTQAREAQMMQKQYELLATQTGSANLDLLQNKAAYTAGRLGALATKQDLSQGDLVGELAKEYADPASPHNGDLNFMMQNVKEIQAQSDTPEALKNFVLQRYATNDKAAKYLEPFLSKPELKDFGGYSQQIETNPFRPNVGQPIGQPIRKTSTPETRMGQVPTMTASGAPGTQSLANVATAQGVDPETGEPLGQGAGPAGSVQTGPSTMQQAWMQRADKQSNEYRQLANDSQNLLINTQEARGLMEGARVGGGTNTREALARTVQGFGDPNSEAMKNLTNEIMGGKHDDALGNTQALQKILFQMAVGAGRRIIGATGLRNESEFEASLNNFAKTESDPAGFTKILDYVDKLSNLAKLKSNAWTKYIASPQNTPVSKDPSNFDNWFNDHVSAAMVKPKGAGEIQ